MGLRARREPPIPCAHIIECPCNLGRLNSAKCVVDHAADAEVSQDSRAMAGYEHIVWLQIKNLHLKINGNHQGKKVDGVDVCETVGEGVDVDVSL